MDLEVSQYFPENLSRVGLSNQDWQHVLDLQETLNSMRTLGEQYEWIASRRSVKAERLFDQRVFQIPMWAEIPENYSPNARNAWWNGSNRAVLAAQVGGKMAYKAAESAIDLAIPFWVKLAVPAAIVAAWLVGMVIYGFIG